MAKVLQMRDEFAATYLQNLQALEQELSIAMEAIAGNALSTLEESVAKQEMLCASLVAMETTARHELRPAMRKAPARQLDTAVAAKVLATGKSVRALNLQYASLLKHSGRSIALLSALCKNHTGQTKEARGSRSKHQTWSCEM